MNFSKSQAKGSGNNQSAVMVIIVAEEEIFISVYSLHFLGIQEYVVS